MFRRYFGAPRLTAGLAPEAKVNLVKSALQKRAAQKTKTFIVKGIAVEAKSYKDAIKILKHQGKI